MLLIRRCWGRGYDVFGKVDGDVKADGEKGRGSEAFRCPGANLLPRFPHAPLPLVFAEITGC